MKQKNLITVVTDHQLTADTIARAIGANEKHDGYYLGNGYAVTWTNGRVIEATFSPCESFVLSTTMDCRLVYAHNFKFAMRDYDSLVGYKKSEQDRKQLATIKVLWAISDIVVNAMIPDITGDLDFLSLYYYLAMPVDVRRAWLPILTKGAIRHGVSHGPSDRREYEAWLEESIYNLLVKATQESLPLEGAPVVEEIPTEEAARTAEALGVEPPKDGDYGVEDKYVAIFTDHKTLYNLGGLLVAAATELDFDHEKAMQTAYTLYTIRYFQYDGEGTLKLVDGPVLVNNDRVLLESKIFRLNYTAQSSDAHKFLVVIQDNFNSTPWEQTFEFNGKDSGDDNGGKTPGVITPVNPGTITPIGL